MKKLMALVMALVMTLAVAAPALAGPSKSDLVVKADTILLLKS